MKVNIGQNFLFFYFMIGISRKRHRKINFKLLSPKKKFLKIVEFFGKLWGILARVPDLGPDLGK